MSNEFEYPEFYSFPPFFTEQPVIATREKQMSLWRELILRYHTSFKIKTLVVHDCPLWKNEEVGRELSGEAIAAVVKDFIKSGHGEWEDDSKTRCRILWRKPEQLASDIYDWAETNGYINSVCTVYELHSGGSILFMRAIILFGYNFQLRFNRVSDIFCYYYHHLR